MTRKPSPNPTSGETNMGRITFSVMPTQKMSPPGAKTVAPISPPKSACDDEDGMPKYQVMRFQMMAPARPASTTPRLCFPGGRPMIPLPTVEATLPPRNEPIRLPTAAMASAMRGVSARVDTDVAMALAASWNPLV